jgi:hypothetical protein
VQKETLDSVSKEKFDFFVIFCGNKKSGKGTTVTFIKECNVSFEKPFFSSIF